MPIENTNDFYLSFEDLLFEAEQERRQITPEKMGSYGIPILDQYTCGIFPDELSVVGADTGMGKSELAYSIAVENAKRGKKVLLFSLEGNLNEIAWRYTQRMINEIEPTKVPEYRVNRKEEHKEYAKRVMQNVHNEGWGENLKIFNKTEVPTFDFIRELIHKSSSLFDMFIIDHLHYIQFPDSRREIEEIGRIMREIKTITDILKKPVILMSHLRKSGRKKGEDPTEHDLYGSSNIAKEASTIVLITRMDIKDNEAWIDKAPVARSYEDEKRYCGTKMIVAKSRAGMPVHTKLALVYDRMGKCYDHRYSCLIKDDSQATEKDVLNNFSF